MSDSLNPPSPNHDIAPGSVRSKDANLVKFFLSYVVGYGLAVLLTVVSFYLVTTHLVWAPSIPIALVALAIAQMGVHLVFFLHITTGPENTNNVMALAFGVLIVFLLLVGSLWIMAHLDHNMMQHMEMPPG